jgi:hypothetical protein
MDGFAGLRQIGYVNQDSHPDTSAHAALLGLPGDLVGVESPDMHECHSRRLLREFIRFGLEMGPEEQMATLPKAVLWGALQVIESCSFEEPSGFPELDDLSRETRKALREAVGTDAPFNRTLDRGEVKAWLDYAQGKRKRFRPPAAVRTILDGRPPETATEKPFEMKRSAEAIEPQP